MRQSELFSKTLKEAPKDEKSISAKLLIRAGFIDKVSSGLYNFLPLGYRVHKKIENIIREEMNNIDAQEVYLVALHPREFWEKTNRWKIKEIFKLKSQSGKEYALSWTHEEIITPLAKKFISSYKDLPKYVYQIQVKMRDELRPKSGVLRTKEFIMKDLYSFHCSKSDLDNYYERVKNAYFKIFERCGILPFTYLTLASGGTFSDYSHEFQTICSAGEDTIYICSQCDFAINKEIKSEFKECPVCGNKNFIKKNTIEVGNIFKLGTKYSKAFNLTFKDKDGKDKIVIMGCYGIGLGRLMGAIVERNNDKNGIIWPEEVAPYKVHLIKLESQEKEVEEISEKIYKEFLKNNIEVLYDDRIDKSPGEKLKEADLIGIPYRVIVSKRTLSKKCVEVKKRSEKKIEMIKVDNLAVSNWQLAVSN